MGPRLCFWTDKKTLKWSGSPFIRKPLAASWRQVELEHVREQIERLGNLDETQGRQWAADRDAR